jgi:hypothetical protein
MAAEAPEASMALAAQALMVKRVSEFFFNVSSLMLCKQERKAGASPIMNIANNSDVCIFPTAGRA